MAKPPIVLVGTKAQFIKTAPILWNLDRAGIEYRLVYTGQHSETFSELERAFGLRSADVNLVPSNEADSARGLLVWLMKVCAALLQRGGAAQWRGASWGMVHGDTLSALVGALALRLIGVPVVHVEAGLRSPKLWSPFPEEIVRRLVSRLASLHCCPDQTAASNIRRGADVIVTSGNTIRDALEMALLAQPEQVAFGGGGSYAVVSMHRAETLTNRFAFDFAMEQIASVAKMIRVRFVLHPATRRCLEKTEWGKRLRACPEIELLERVDYPTFVGWLLNARFLLTDGGSNQEEAALLGLPTLLLRKETERADGIESGIVAISAMDPERIQNFVERHRLGSWPIRVLPKSSPARQIVDELIDRFGKDSPDYDTPPEERVRRS